VSLDHSASIEGSAHHSLDSIPFEYSLGEVLQQCIRALADSFTPVSVPGCSLHAHARCTTSGEVKKTNNEKVSAVTRFILCKITL
jgi:hypothetical protein